MTRSIWRYGVCAVAVVASWGVLLLWAAGARWSDPFSPPMHRSIGGSTFHEVFGRAVARDGRLAVQAPAEDYSTLQSASVDIEAADFAILRYRFVDFPRTLELSLVFRTAAAPDDVQTISLPWPGSGDAAFDLSQVPAWRGTIIEIGFAEFATAQLVPPARGFAPFELDHAVLWAKSWRGDLAALATDWFGAWPWSQRSVHALGREGDAPHARSAIVFAALAAAASIGWLALLSGLRARRVAIMAFACAIGAWVLLDLRWQIGLFERLAATRSLYADLPWEQRKDIVGDDGTLRVANELKTLLRDEPGSARILVQSSSGYSVLRLMWHLLPLNTAALWSANPGAPLPEGCLIVFYDSDAWRRDPAMRRLLARSERIWPNGVLMKSGFEGDGEVVVFRYRHAH
jgi:hypothetical protein